jgi:hypothetical protein
VKPGDVISASYTTTAVAASPIGTYPNTASLNDPGNKLGNYTVTNTPALLSVTPAPLSVTAASFTRLYGAANPTFTGTIAGIKNSDNITATYASPATSASAIGTYAITPTLVDPSSKLGNYTVTINNGTLTVNPAPLTITATPATKLLNAPNPPLSGTYAGLVNGDTPTSLSGTLSCTTTAITTSPVGSYTITCSGKSSTNYTITYVVGTLKISYAIGGICAGDVGHAIRQPINGDGSSVFKLGSTVPTKFAVCDANGVSISTPGLVTGYGLVASAFSPNITTDEDIFSTTPDTAFRWDASGQQWIFNQSTKNNSTLKSGVIYFFAINLNDGSSISFQYGLR